MTPTEQQRLAEIEERLKRATPGPWIPHCRAVGVPSTIEAASAWPDTEFLQWYIEGPLPPIGRGQFCGADVAFIASAPADIEWLIQQVRKNP